MADGRGGRKERKKADRERVREREEEGGKHERSRNNYLMRAN